MATSLPYLASNKNVEALFTAILSAKVPEKFTQAFLRDTIGLGNPNDRQMIPLLRSLKFLDQSGSPTAPYRTLKNREMAKFTLAAGIKEAYRPLFDANENAHSLNGDKLKGLIAQVAGTDDDMTSRISGTFSALVKQADFSKADEPESRTSKNEEEAEEKKDPSESNLSTRKLRPEFHYNIQIHLPNNATEDVYLNIFNALRKTFQ